MGCDERHMVVLQDVTVEVFADVYDVTTLQKQCLSDDNPGRVSVTQFGYPDHSQADIVIWVTQDGPYKYGALARLVKTMVDGNLRTYTDPAGNMVWWREG